VSFDDLEIGAAQTAHAPTMGAPVPDGGLERGASVGRYIVIERIGAGGMGVVYAAFDPELGRRVAIKLLATRGGASEGKARLLREAQAMAQVSHPNVIAVHDAGTVGDDVFLAMELRAGTTLADWLRARKRGWREVLPVFVQAGRGLEAAHKAGLVHRDFKPENVHVGDDGRVCVLDFGLARPAGDRGPAVSETGAIVDRPVSSAARLDTPLTEAGALVGTPQYMEPEQHAREATDGRTDQFGFCVALYEALYGQRPFEGATVGALARAVSEGVVEAPPKNSDVPGWLRAAVVRGLSARPDDRFPSMSELLAVIDRDAKRRRGTLVAAAGGAAMIAAVAIVLVSRKEGAAAPPVCRGATETIAASWGAPQRDALKRRFVASGLPFAGDTADRTIAALDRWTNGWARIRTERCEATHVRGEQSEEVLALTMQCLDRRKLELDALVQVLSAADAKVVEEAVGATGKLADVDACADVAALGEPPPPPRGKEQELEAIAKQLAEAMAQFAAGRYEDAKRAVTPAVQAADALGHKPLQAEVDHLAARIASTLGNGEEAEKMFDAALLAAIEGRMDELAIRIATDRAALLGLERARPADALVQAKLADALLGRAGRPEVLAAELDLAVGAILRAQGDGVAARERLERAAAALEHVYGRDAPELGKVALQLGILAYTQGRYDDAETWFDRVRAIREAQLGPEHPQVGNILVNVGVARMHLGRYPESSAAFERALAILEPKLGPEHLTLVKLHNNLGMLESRQRRFESALERHQRALAIYEKLPGTTEVDVAATLINLAVAQRNLGRLDEAIALDRRVIGIYEKAYGKTHPDLAYPLTELGRCFVAQRRFDDAIAPLRRARAVRAGQEEDPSERAEAELALAQAL
jgi:tetratricopeptide (TPR) repeat protein